MIQPHQLPVVIQKYYDHFSNFYIQNITANRDGQKFIITHAQGSHVWEWYNGHWEVTHK